MIQEEEKECIKRRRLSPDYVFMIISFLDFDFKTYKNIILVSKKFKSRYEDLLQRYIHTSNQTIICERKYMNKPICSLYYKWLLLREEVREETGSPSVYIKLDKKGMKLVKESAIYYHRFVSSKLLLKYQVENGCEKVEYKIRDEVLGLMKAVGGILTGAFIFSCIYDFEHDFSPLMYVSIDYVNEMVTYCRLNGIACHPIVKNEFYKLIHHHNTAIKIVNDTPIHHVISLPRNSFRYIYTGTEVFLNFHFDKKKPFVGDYQFSEAQQFMKIYSKNIDNVEFMLGDMKIPLGPINLFVSN